MGSLDLPHTSSFKGGSETFLRDVLEGILKNYLRKNPMAKTIWELVQSVDDNEKISYDHFFFRTFKVDGYGIDSLANFFLDYGYTVGGRLDFPKKKVHVLWLSPPAIDVPGEGYGLGNGPLPRLVFAELLVDELTPKSQEIIRKYLKPQGGKQAVLSSTLGSLIWDKPTSTDFHHLAKESEFGAWTLVYGYTMNHLAFAVHRLKHRFSDIKCVKEYFEEKGFELNQDGGVIKVSEDALLLQVSSISEKLAVEFADGVTETVPASYIEFVQRLTLPEFKDMPQDEIKECHRREGLEQASAYHVMESTRFTPQV
uniref:2-oxoadipate dioxygenase/decarboxylase n=1 Tax=Noccaea caerulescens TaxID=107243 RepID=A0A1J3EEF8_NOCCA